MRSIKFRAWDNDEKKMFYDIYCRGVYILENIARVSLVTGNNSSNIGY
nr:MAG TPA: YopX protein [Caudoviricetes sp.]